MEVSGSLPVLAVLPRQRTPVPTEQETGWTFWEREKSLAPTGTRIPDRPARRTIPLPSGDISIGRSWGITPLILNIGNIYEGKSSLSRSCRFTPEEEAPLPNGPYSRSGLSQISYSCLKSKDSSVVQSAMHSLYDWAIRIQQEMVMA